MRILFIAPQPFYEERGTVIAVDLLLQALSERGDEVDLLTYHLGENRVMQGLEIVRIRPRPSPTYVRPGPSVAKLWADIFITFRAFSLARSRDYDLVYAVEEAAFIAMIIKKLYSIPFVFDMDSSMPDQIIERYSVLSPAAGLFRWMESLPIRRAEAVVPMCESIADRARPDCQGFVQILKDVSLLNSGETPDEPEDLRSELGLQGPTAMYIGNLEPYQGIDLLLDSFKIVSRDEPSASLVIIGGNDSDIQKYKAKSASLGLAEHVHIIGQRPVSQLGYYMSQADVLVSPRTQGDNTPMKVYSYLDSGVPVVATNLPTHTQVMTEDVARLPEPNAESFAKAVAELFGNTDERARLAENARDLVRREHSEEAFRRQVGELFGRLEEQIAP